jgi:hypothetical protein
VPQHPQRVLDHAAAGERVRRGAQQQGQVAGRAADRGLHRGEYRGLGQRLPDQLVRGPRRGGGRPFGPLPGQRLLGAQRPAEPAQVAAVQAGQRPGQQGARGLRGERGGLRGAAQREQQRGHRGLAGRRQVLGADPHRHVARGQRPAQRAELAAGAGEHRHLVPGEAVLEVRAAQQVGQRGVLHRGGRAAARRGQLAVLAHLLRGQPVQRHPAGDPAGGGEQPRPRTPAGAEHSDRRGPAVRAGEALGELEDPVEVGAAEGVDRLVGVAHHDQVAAVAGQRPQQPDLGRVGVLVFVHEDHPVGLAQPGAHLGGLGEQHGAVHEFGVVEHAAGVGHVQVLAEEAGGGAPVVPVGALGEAAQGRRVEALLAGPQQHGAQLLGEAAGAEGGAQRGGPARPRRPAPLRVPAGGRVDRAAHQLADDDVLLGP